MAFFVFIALKTLRFYHASEIGTKYATEDAREVGMMAESVAVSDWQAAWKSRNANGLACSVGGADRRWKTLAGQRRRWIHDTQMTAQGGEGVGDVV